MTWSARATVQDVSDGPSPIDVLLVCNAEDTWEGADGKKYPSLSSNTEGKIRSVEIKLVLDEDETSLAIGDVVQVYGHFQGK